MHSVETLVVREGAFRAQSYPSCSCFSGLHEYSRLPLVKQFIEQQLVMTQIMKPPLRNPTLSGPSASKWHSIKMFWWVGGCVHHGKTRCSSPATFACPSLCGTQHPPSLMPSFHSYWPLKGHAPEGEQQMKAMQHAHTQPYITTKWETTGAWCPQRADREENQTPSCT